MKRLILFAVILFPLAAMAQDGAAAPDAFEKLAGGIASIAVAIFLAVLEKFWSANKQAVTEKTHRAIAVAYGATTNVAKFTATKVDDKAAYALGVLKQQLELQGLQLTPAIETQAKATWDAMHAQEKLTAGALPLDPAAVERLVEAALRKRLDAMTLPSRP